MTWNCPDPRANPLNTRLDGNFNVLAQDSGRHRYFRRPENPSELGVPVAKPFSFRDLPSPGDSLQVPHQDQVPMGMENDITFIQKDRFLRLSDGTVMDLEKRKVFREGNLPEKGSWGSRTIRWDGGREEKEWGNPLEWSPRGGNSLEGGLSRDDLEYERISKVMNKKLEDGMSDEQRELLSNLDGILGKSKFVEESKTWAT